MSDKKKFSQTTTLLKWLRYALEVVIAALVLELIYTWLGENTRLFNNFQEISTYLSGKSLTMEDVSVIVTLLSTHHQSLANLLTIAGVIATVITILFYLEGQDRKRELEERFDELSKRIGNIATDAEVMNECQQLIDSILLHFWTINESQTDLSPGQEEAEKIKIVHRHLHYSSEIKCILSKDNEEQINKGLKKLKELVQSISSEEEKSLVFEVERLLRSLYKIGRLSKDDQYNIANSILTLMGKTPLKNEP